MCLCVCVCVFVSPVISFCAAAGQAPEVSVEPRAATVHQGESASFRCQVQGGAQPIQLMWKKANNNNQALPGQEWQHVTLVHSIWTRVISPCILFPPSRQCQDRSWRLRADGRYRRPRKPRAVPLHGGQLCRPRRRHGCAERQMWASVRCLVRPVPLLLRSGTDHTACSVCFRGPPIKLARALTAIGLERA